MYTLLATGAGGWVWTAKPNNARLESMVNVNNVQSTNNRLFAFNFNNHFSFLGAQFSIQIFKLPATCWISEVKHFFRFETWQKWVTTCATHDVDGVLVLLCHVVIVTSNSAFVEMYSTQYH